MLKINNLCVELSNQKILNNLSFEIPQGVFLSIVGPNGAGKSTLAKSLNGLIKQKTKSKEIILDGKPLSDYTPREIALKISYVPQNIDLSFDYPVLDFVMMSRYPHKNTFESYSSQDYSIAKNSLLLTDSLEFKNRNFNTLSGGEKQRVLIAAALTQETSLIILDEPNANLDSKHQDEIMQLLFKLNTENSISIIHITHDLNHALQSSTHILALKDGSISFWGDPIHFAKTDILNPLFEKEFSICPHPRLNTPMIVSDLNLNLRPTSISQGVK
jgi:iron complex transport system ATP-binding protein